MGNDRIAGVLVDAALADEELNKRRCVLDSLVDELDSSLRVTQEVVVLGQIKVRPQDRRRWLGRQPVLQICATDPISHLVKH